jgi:hypothetical protein
MQRGTLLTAAANRIDGFLISPKIYEVIFKLIKQTCKVLDVQRSFVFRNNMFIQPSFFVKCTCILCYSFICTGSSTEDPTHTHCKRQTDFELTSVTLTGNIVCGLLMYGWHFFSLICLPLVRPVVLQPDLRLDLSEAASTQYCSALMCLYCTIHQLSHRFLGFRTPNCFLPYVRQAFYSEYGISPFAVRDQASKIPLVLCKLRNLDRHKFHDIFLYFLLPMYRLLQYSSLAYCTRA